MALKIGAEVRLGPAITEIQDVVDLGGGRFALAGKDNGDSHSQKGLIWWFDSSGGRTGKSVTHTEAGERIYGGADLSAGDGRDVLAARTVRPEVFTGDFPVVAQKHAPGKSGPERELLDGSDVQSLVQVKAEPWGKGHAVAKSLIADASPRFGLEFLRLDGAGREKSSQILRTESDRPIQDIDMAETKGGGYAVAAQFYNTSAGIWLWTLNKSGKEVSSQRIDRFGGSDSITGSRPSDVDVEVLARGDVLVAWNDGPLVARRFDADGTPLGHEIVIDKDANAHGAEILALDNGGFLAAWKVPVVKPTGNSWATKVREFDATGNAVGRAKIATENSDVSQAPWLVGDGNGGANLIWHDRWWDGIGDVRDFVPHAVIQNVDATWKPGKILQGSKARDNLDGTARDDLIDGKGGRDNLKGGAGDDDMRGGGGNDKITGGRGRDVIEGGGGRDRVNGGKGNDELAAGAGNDILTGGAGRDLFLFRENKGDDVITDFDDSRDVIRLEGELFGSLQVAGQPQINESGGDTILSFLNLDATITLKGVTDLDYDINFLSGSILIY